MPANLLLFCNFLLFVTHLTDEGALADLGDLGNLMLGGFVLAVLVAIAFTFVRLKMREKKPPPAQFISINSYDRKK